MPVFYIFNNKIFMMTVSQNSAILNFSSFYKEAPEHGTTENQ